VSNIAPGSKIDGIKFAFYEELRINYLVDALTSLISMYGYGYTRRSGRFFLATGRTGAGTGRNCQPRVGSGSEFSAPAEP